MYSRNTSGGEIGEGETLLFVLKGFHAFFTVYIFAITRHSECFLDELWRVLQISELIERDSSLNEQPNRYLNLYREPITSYHIFQ